MAGNTQFHQEAFQAADTGIDISIAQRAFNTVEPATLPATPLGDGTYSAEAVNTFMENTPVPDDAFSMGVNTGSVQAFHFDVISIGRGPSNAVSTHSQSFYVVGPGGQ